MKPLGMTPTFQIVKPDRIQDAIYEATQQAIDAGWTVDQFRREAAACWRIYLDERQRLDAEVWRK